ncbi:MAG: anaerobic selenocysteine-containing dehydrogenase [Saprospiraceae bacterium]|jgi:anaerobic selenocysteine-containing dehydrogenase
MTENTTTTHYRACNLCEAICGLEIEVKGREVISIKGDKKDPFSKGYLCPKAIALQDIYTDKNRLKQPIRRTVNGWETISWDTAYDEVISNIKRIQEEHGNSAIGAYLGNPNVHNFGSILFLPDFLRSLKTPNLFSATSADQLPHHFVSHQMFGHYFAIPVCDVDRTDYMLILGANPLVSNGSLMTAPGFRNRMKGIQERGKVVVIDPRKSETADKADEHHFIKPGSDALFLLSIIHVFFAEGLTDLGHLKGQVKNLEAIEEFAKGFAPEETAKFTGILAEETRRIAHEFMGAKRAVCYGRMGLSVQEFGGLCIWLVNLVNILSNNFDKEGGAMFTSPAMDSVVERSKGKIGRWKSRVSQRPERFGELPVSVMLEEIATEGPGQIKAMITAAGNPVLSTPNGASLEKALEGLEYMVSIDIYLNETTKHASIILPPTTGLETSNYDTVFHLLAVQNTAKYSPPTFEKTEEQRHDFQILQELTKRMNAEYQPRFETPEEMTDMGLRHGNYSQMGISIQQLKDQPHGVDLGPLRPALAERLFTEDKLVDLAPASLLGDLDRLRKVFSSNGNGVAQKRFQLIGRRDLRTNNSWMHNSYRLVKGGNRCTLLINPMDAAELNISENQEVEVQSKTGKLRIQTEISKEMMRGVVSIPHGWGHDREGIALDVASAHAGVSINDVTDDKFMDELTGNAAFNGVWVTVSI